MTNLRYDLNAASDCKEERHPQDVVEGLGITYKKAIPKLIADQWWFDDCENVPNELPDYISERDS